MLAYFMGSVGSTGFGSSTTAAQVAERCAEAIAGRVFVVTGCNTGIGLETVRQLHRHGGTVVMACRSEERMQAGRDTVLGEDGADGGKGDESSVAPIHAIPCDLGSLESVRAFERAFAALGLPSCDVLINNAGVMMCPEAETADGNEMQLGTNHLGHFLLTNLMMPHLKKADPPGRVVMLASEAHKWCYRGGMQFDNLRQQGIYDAKMAYGHSKLANILHAREFARRAKEAGSPITALSVHPGVIPGTDLMRHFPSLVRPLARTLMVPFCKTVPQGAATTMYAALAPAEEVAEHNGEYLFDVNYHMEDVMVHGRSAEQARRLWEASVEITGSDTEF